MKPSQSIMNDQHRAMPWQWETIERNHHHAAFSCLLELHDRIKALEAAQQAHADASHVVDSEKEKMAQELMQAAGFAPLWTEAELRAGTRLHSYKVGKAEPVENWGEGHTLVDPPVYAAQPAKSNHPEFPDSSLLSRVACADGPADAILEIAAWLREHYGPIASEWAMRLEREAER